MNSLKFSATVLLATFLISCSNSKINTVSIDSPPESLFKGSSVQLVAVVKGEGNPDTTLNWVIVDQVSKGTSISKDGLLTISGDETAKSVTIKAISAMDTSKATTVKVKIEANKKSFYGSWTSVKENKDRTLDISENSLVFKYLYNGSGYTVSDLKWVPVYNDDPATKEDFPSGFYATGNISKSYNNESKMGVLQKNVFFISLDGSRILRMVDNDTSNQVVWTKKN
jgi:hypothetical protein